MRFSSWVSIPASFLLPRTPMKPLSFPVLGSDHLSSWPVEYDQFENLRTLSERGRERDPMEC